MEIQTISQVSKRFNISTRTLRYYEQIGLLQPVKKAGSTYRSYDESEVVQLQQIIILRKLRIPLKQIAEIIKSKDTAVAIKAFQQKLIEIDGEITALSTIKSVIQAFLDRLDLKSDKLQLMDDESLLEIVDSLTVSKINFKGEKSMKELNQANEKLNQLTDKDVRIIYLPPATVAAYQCEGDEPENKVAQLIDKFVLDDDLPGIKPDLRHYGFNAPNPVDETNYHGYEMWVTIPENMEVLEPLVKKHFEGGLYDAHMIPFGAFEEWEWLAKWVRDSEKYEYNGNWDSKNMFGWLEESLNYVNRVKQPDPEGEGFQLDLLIPIKEKTAVS